MIYVENTSNYPQRVFIPRNDGDENTDIRGYRFQNKEYNIDHNGTTYIYPDPGYDGITAGTINVDVPTDTEEAYENGVRDGKEEQKAKLEPLTANTNGHYSREDGYSDVYVDVQGGGGSGVLTAGTFTQNGQYNPPQGTDGWSAVTVDVDTASTYSEGYSAGTEHQKSLLSSTTITNNGRYSREDGWSAVTVNVPPVSGATQIIIDADHKNIPDYGIYYFVYDRHTNYSAMGLKFGVSAESYITAVYDVVSTGDTTLYGLVGNAVTMEIDGVIYPPQSTWDFGSTGLKTVKFGLTGDTTVMRVPIFYNSRPVSVSLGKEITTIPMQAFSNVPLTSITFETGSRLRDIRVSAFEHCPMMSIDLPDTLDFVAGFAFNTCSNLSSITCRALTAPEIEYYSFVNLPSSGILHVPTGSDYSSWLAQLPSGWTVQYI
jgi:hypothetical protein